MKQHEPSFNFRTATRSDIPLIQFFIRQLAIYEKMEDQITSTDALLESWLFDRKAAEVIFVMEETREVGFALFFHNFSTFRGQAGLYLEDLYVLPDYRGHGYGKALLKKLASIAIERECARFEWVCLDWNKPSIDFYLSLGAVPMEDWTVYRVTDDALIKLGTEF